MVRSYMVHMMLMEIFGSLAMLTSVMDFGLMDNIHMSQQVSILIWLVALDLEVIVLILKDVLLSQEIAQQSIQMPTY